MATTDANTLLEQLDVTFEKIARIDFTNDRADKEKMKAILQRLIIICKDLVAKVQHVQDLQFLEQKKKKKPIILAYQIPQQPDRRHNARIRIRICNSVAVKHGREIAAPSDWLRFNYPIQNFPKTLLELCNVTEERRIDLLAHFGFRERGAREMGAEAGMLALRVWSGLVIWM
ncbi:MAG: hypothetical protein Q9175_005767 [Cornicularia normoerica]